MIGGQSGSDPSVPKSWVVDHCAFSPSGWPSGFERDPSQDLLRVSLSGVSRGSGLVLRALRVQTFDHWPVHVPPAASGQLPSTGS